MHVEMLPIGVKHALAALVALDRTNAYMVGAKAGKTHGLFELASVWRSMMDATVQCEYIVKTKNPDHAKHEEKLRTDVTGKLRDYGTKVQSGMKGCDTISKKFEKLIPTIDKWNFDDFEDLVKPPTPDSDAVWRGCGQSNCFLENI